MNNKNSFLFDLINNFQQNMNNEHINVNPNGNLNKIITK